ncbi:TPA: internal head protein, partial [Escherichia coli]|nr:internal head protein [Escherichia coli]HCQ2344999.1 internal head protein [Escherichia coli]
STDMAEIRNARGNVREAIAALQAAGRFEENEELVNGAARHLADLLVAIQKAGVAA